MKINPEIFTTRLYLDIISRNLKSPFFHSPKITKRNQSSILFQPLMPFNHYARELCARSDKWNTKRMHLLTPSIVKTNLEKSRNISHETSEIFQRIINHIISYILSYNYSWNVRNYIVDHISNRSELERIRFDVEHWLDLWIRRSRCAKNFFGKEVRIDGAAHDTGERRIVGAEGKKVENYITRHLSALFST